MGFTVKFERRPQAPYLYIGYHDLLQCQGTSKLNQHGCHDGSPIQTNSGLILGLCPANERRRYFVTTSLIGWAQA